MNGAHSQQIPKPIGHGQRRPAFVGNMGLTFGQHLDPAAANSCAGWFMGTEVHYVHAARTAIHKAIRLLGLRAGDEVLVPAYNCGSEVDALIQADVRVRLFRTTLSGQVDLDDLKTRITRATRAVYVIHYFGFAQPMESAVNCCRERGLFLIEDCALSAFSAVGGQRIGSSGDIAIYNFPKVLPVPDGGALVVNNPKYRNQRWELKRPASTPIAANLTQLFKPCVLRQLPRRAVVFGFRLRGRRRASSRVPANGHIEMPRSYFYDSRAMSDRGISKVSEWLLKRTELGEVRRRRRRNFAWLLERTAGVAGVRPLYKELPEDACPLFFPILVERPHEVVRSLRSLSIPAIPWWSGYHPGNLNWASFPDACYLKDHIVAVPIHQQLSDAALETIDRGLRECLASTARG